MNIKILSEEKISEARFIKYLGNDTQICVVCSWLKIIHLFLLGVYIIAAKTLTIAFQFIDL